MGAYILRRILLMIPTLLGIMIINFTLVQFVPGGPIAHIISQLDEQTSATDRIAGGDPVQSTWPRDDRGLRFSERQEMQKLLTRAGFNTKGADGIIGPNTIAAIRAFQRAQRLTPDGHASYDILSRLR